MSTDLLAPTAPSASRAAQEPAPPDTSTRLTGVREATRYVRWFEQITKADVAVVGGKGANLGELTRAGFPVPPGFVVTVDAYRRFAEVTRVGNRIREQLSALDVDNPDALRRMSDAIQTLVRDAVMPDEVRSDILAAYTLLACCSRLRAAIPRLACEVHMSAQSLSTTLTSDPDVNEPPELALPLISLGDQLRYCPIVVAVSGEPAGAGPVRVASALEARYGSRVSAIQVLDVSDLPLPTPIPAVFTFARNIIGDAPYAEDAEARRRQFSDWLGHPNEWPVRISLGAPAYEILRYAESHGAALIVMGLRHHGVVDRILRDETTLTVARRARGVVLAVTPTLIGLPHRAIVGVDFGPASIRAARAALDVLGHRPSTEGTTLRLVYVDRSGVEGIRDDTAGEALIKHLGVDAAFEQLVRELAAPPGVHVESVIRHGVPAAELLACADESRADLIAVGSLRHERLERWILGSVTTEVIRDGRCSVLIIPPRHDD